MPIFTRYCLYKWGKRNPKKTNSNPQQESMQKLRAQSKHFSNRHYLSFFFFLFLLLIVTCGRVYAHRVKKGEEEAETTPVFSSLSSQPIPSSLTHSSYFFVIGCFSTLWWCCELSSLLSLSLALAQTRYTKGRKGG